MTTEDAAKNEKPKNGKKKAGKQQEIEDPVEVRTTIGVLVFL